MHWESSSEFSFYNREIHDDDGDGDDDNDDGVSLRCVEGGSRCSSSSRKPREPHRARGWLHASGPKTGWSTKAHLRLNHEKSNQLH